MGNDMFNDEQLAHAEIVQKETEDALGWWKDRALKAEAALSALSRARETDGAVREAAEGYRLVKQAADECDCTGPSPCYHEDIQDAGARTLADLVLSALSAPPRDEGRRQRRCRMSEARKRAEEALAKWDSPVARQLHEKHSDAVDCVLALRALLADAPPADAATEAVRYRAELEFLSEWLLKFHGSINFATVVAMRERLRDALSSPPRPETTSRPMTRDEADAVEEIESAMFAAPPSDAIREAAERLALLRMVAAEGCRDKPGSGVTCREAGVPPDEVCEVCRVIKYLSAQGGGR